MPSLIERRRNNVRAGVFVSLALVATIATVLVLSDAWTRFTHSRTAYIVRYPVSSGVKNLKKGAQVRVGGIVLGEVIHVRPDLDTPAFDTIDVEFVLDDEVVLYQTAQIYISSALLGADAWLDITSVGDPGDALAEGEALVGEPTLGLLAGVLGPESARDTEEIIENARAVTSHLNEHFADDYDRIVDDVQSVTGDVRGLAHRIAEEDWPAWSARVTGVFDRVEALQAKLDEALAVGHALLEDGRGVVGENRESIREIVSNVRATSEDARAFADRLEGELADKANRLLETGNEALDEAVAAVRQIRTDYETWAIGLGETLGNASLASQQLKLAMIEVRRSPWRLLYQPEPEELQHELLYEATRSFAMATADLKAAARSMQAILDEHGDFVREDRELFDRVTESLLGPLSNYEEAQSRLLAVIFNGS